MSVGLRGGGGGGCDLGAMVGSGTIKSSFRICRETRLDSDTCVKGARPRQEKMDCGCWEVVIPRTWTKDL